MNGNEFTFTGKSYGEMVTWLGDHGLDVLTFDSIAFKPLRLLWGEHRREVTLRWDDEKKRILRIARTVRIAIVVGDFSLREVKRIYSRGEVHKDDWWSISETLYRGEDALSAVFRGTWQESGIKLERRQIDMKKFISLHRAPPEPYESSTYPGIWTCAIPEYAEARLDERPWEDPPTIEDHGVLIPLMWDIYRPPTQFHWLLK